ncbi:MAG: glycyl-radical enzyme activating protein [Bacteroidetes bacterium]|nr:glycyl-radical enzyme activating protein [Bacteroidota bacterium]
MNKGLIFEIRRFTVHDGPGIRSTVFFKGCQLGCWWCHNPESRSSIPEECIKTINLDGKTFYLKETIGNWMTVDEVIHEIRLDRIFFEESGGGVTFSGGEPLMQHDFLLEVLKECRNNGIHTAIDTSGNSDPETLEKIAGHADLFLYDLKLMDEADHIRFTGVSNKIILENLMHLVSEGREVNVRFPVIPGITDTDKNVREIKEFLLFLRKKNKSGKPLITSLLPYHSSAKNKYRRLHVDNKMSDMDDLTRESLFPLKNEFEAEGLDVRIGS